MPPKQIGYVERPVCPSEALNPARELGLKPTKLNARGRVFEAADSRTRRRGCNCDDHTKSSLWQDGGFRV